MNTRLEHLRSWLIEENIDFALIQSKANVFYLSSVYSEPHERLIGIVVFPHEDPIFICPRMEVLPVKNSGWQYQIIGYNDSQSPWELLKQTLTQEKRNISTIAIEKEAISYARVEALLDLCPKATLVSVEEKLHSLRVVKDTAELSILKEAAQLADFGVEVGIHYLAKGKKEMEIIAQIEYELKRKGVREMSFSTMVLTGKNTADPHGTPGLSEVKKGDFVLFDLGVVLDGYCSDITRTVAFQDVSTEQRRIYETVYQAQLAALSICKIGTRVGDIDLAARSIITEAGFGDFFPHRIGHGLGIDVHEFPSMSDNNDNSLKEGNVFTIEPGIYVPGIGGVRIEDDVVITNDGYELLTKYPKDLIII